MKIELLNELEQIKTDFKNKNYQKQIPNMLTSSRLLSPFILIPLFYYNKLQLAFIMIIIFSLTDMFDGYFARKYNAISNFGKYLDAFVDKVFALSILISLILKTQLTNNLYLSLIVIVLEIVICIINTYSFFKQYKPFSTIYGKIKTCFLFGLLAILFLNKIIIINNIFRIIFTIITIIFQIGAILSYIIQVENIKIKNSKSI